MQQKPRTPSTTICNRCNNSKKHTSWFRHWKRGRNFWTIKTRKLYKAELDGNSLFDATRRPRKLSWILDTQKSHSWKEIPLYDSSFSVSMLDFGGVISVSLALKQDAGHGVFIECQNVFLAITQNYKKQVFYKTSSRKNLGQNPNSIWLTHIISKLHPRSLTARPWKMVIGRHSPFLLGFGIFSGANF